MNIRRQKSWDYNKERLPFGSLSYLIAQFTI